MGETETLRCLHRESLPPRQCSAKGCHVWLSSRNPTDLCCACGGWREVDDGKQTGEDLRELMQEAA